MRGSWWIRFIFVGIVAVLILGLNHLIRLRFESGRAYAPLSSLRTDPLGAKALHDAFESVDGLTVERNFVPLDQIQTFSPDATIFALNVDGYALFNKFEIRPLREFVEEGGRLLLALNASNVAYEHIMDEDDPRIEEEESDEDLEEDSDSDEDGVTFTRRSPLDEWGIWEDLALRHGEHEGGRAMRAETAPGALPEELPWREGGILVEFDDSVWVPVYKVGEEVVAVTRDYGEGSIVILTDSYLFSNQALLRHRYTEFLTWAAGEHGRIIFEETHLGVSERTGIAVLMRRYGLYHFVVAFGVFMLLVAWRGSQPLLPPYSHKSKSNLVLSERSVEVGFCDLVGRQMRGSELAIEAFRIWKESFIRNKSDEARYAAELAEINEILNQDRDLAHRKRNPAQTHSQIKSIINRKRRKHL